MRILSFLFIIVFLYNLPIHGQSKADTKITAERFYQWNGVGWIPEYIDDYVFDESGKMTNMVRYLYDASGNFTSSQNWTCTNYSTYYTLSYIYYHDSFWPEFGGITKTWTYKYNLNGVKIGYSDIIWWQDQAFWEKIDHTFTYIYDNNLLTVVDEVYVDSYYGLLLSYYNYHTDLFYDPLGRVLTENKKYCEMDHVWIDKERTNWVYENNIGTGTRETLPNTEWILTDRKIRDLNEVNKPITEERQHWLQTQWVIDEIDYNYYNYYDESFTKTDSAAFQHLNLTHTLRYNHNTDTYEKFKYHEILYEIVGPLSTPSNIATTISGSQLTLTWGAVNGATSYLVYSSLVPYGDFTLDTTGTLNGTTWTTVLTDRKKFYKVTAVREEK